MFDEEAIGKEQVNLEWHITIALDLEQLMSSHEIKSTETEIQAEKWMFVDTSLSVT